MRVGLKYNGRELNLNVRNCNWFKKFIGLMFSRREKARALLLFDFKKPRRIGIHSFFCPRFLAVWLDKKNNIIEKRIVHSFNPLILPKRKFSRLVEIPINEKYDKMIKDLLADESPSVVRNIKNQRFLGFYKTPTMK